MSDIDYSRLPLHMQDSARDYIEKGVAPGPFLTNLITNNLYWTLAYADDDNVAALREWREWIRAIPFPAWGSSTHLDAWISKGGNGGEEPAA